MRSCSTCTLCCTVTRVPELTKPEGVTCRHCADGCSIYSERPESCRKFNCAWLSGDLSDAMRPDLIGVMVERLTPRTVLVLGKKRDWRTAEIEAELRAAYVDHGVAVAAFDHTALLPEGVSAEALVSDIVEAARGLGVI